MRVSEVAESLGVKKSAVRKAIKRNVMVASQSYDESTGSYEYDVAPDEVERYRSEHRRDAKTEGDETDG